MSLALTCWYVWLYKAQILTILLLHSSLCSVLHNAVYSIHTSESSSEHISSLRRWRHNYLSIRSKRRCQMLSNFSDIFQLILFGAHGVHCSLSFPLFLLSAFYIKTDNKSHDTEILLSSQSEYTLPIFWLTKEPWFPSFLHAL